MTCDYGVGLLLVIDVRMNLRTISVYLRCLELHSWTKRTSVDQQHAEQEKLFKTCFWILDLWIARLNVVTILKKNV